MAGGELRRSYTQMEFSVNRDRSFNIRPQLQHIAFHHSVRDLGNRKRYSMMPTSRIKHATMEIYRPPNVRLDGNIGPNGMAMQPRLNVHAKEFTMMNSGSAGLQSSRSSGNLATVMSGNNGFAFSQPVTNSKTMLLQQSKTGGNMLNSLQQSKSSGNILHTLQPVSSGLMQQPAPRVHFARTTSASTAGENNVRSGHKTTLSGLKRSKSLTAADAIAIHTDLGPFPFDVTTDMEQALRDPNEMSARSLMQLVKHVVDRATDNRHYAEPAAKLCINIIEKEKKRNISRIFAQYLSTVVSGTWEDLTQHTWKISYFYGISE
uniref:MIF4G domain-containing protein n=1 Tax=Clastoptera arizonana TaxID=38151 RepID=A0A1B6CNF2_9HEMI